MLLEGWPSFPSSSHTGLYVDYVPIGNEGGDLLVVFDTRWSEEAERIDLLPVRGMFAPLKALPDEARLEILKMLRVEEPHA